MWPCDAWLYCKGKGEATEVVDDVPPLCLALRFQQKAIWSLQLILFQIVVGTFVSLLSAYLIAVLSLPDSIVVFLLLELFWFATCCVPVPSLVDNSTSNAVAWKEWLRSFMELMAVDSLLHSFCFQVSKLGCMTWQRKTVQRDVSLMASPHLVVRWAFGLTTISFSCSPKCYDYCELFYLSWDFPSPVSVQMFPNFFLIGLQVVCTTFVCHMFTDISFLLFQSIRSVDLAFCHLMTFVKKFESAIAIHEVLIKFWTGNLHSSVLCLSHRFVIHGFAVQLPFIH